MTLTYAELESITTDYFMADNKQAVDIYFNTSFLLNHLLKQQKGLWERPPGGNKIRVPLEYDGQEAAFYSRGDTISSDDRESVNAAYFDWKHSYGNATVYRIDTLKNAGPYAEVQLATQKVAGAQKSLTKLLAGSVYDSAGGGSNRLTGLLACCNETATLAYGGIAENDLVAQDGTKPWEGKNTATAAVMSLGIIRDVATACKLADGPNGKPDLVTMTETLFNVVLDILQVQQRFTESKTTVTAGFTGLSFEGKDIFPDDYCPSGSLFALNTNHIGFAVHPVGYFMRSPWKVIPDSAEDKTMKIYFDGNLIVNNRKAHMARTGLTAS
jgi:hypothetical protein